MTDLTFEAGHVFFRPGDHADEAFLLTEGEVEVVHGSGQHAATLGRYGPEDVFGEMSLIQERLHAGTARALTPGRASALTRRDFERLLLTDPVRCRQYLKSLFERLRHLAAQVAHEDEPAAPRGQLVLTEEVAPGPVMMPTDGPRPPARKVVLVPLTKLAAETLPDDGLVVDRFPFRLGRAVGANEPEGFDLNDVWLIDHKPFTISRNHCAIDLDGEDVVVRDRGSYLGCSVNNWRIGGFAPWQVVRLEAGENTLILGNPDSPYRFKVEVGHPN